MENKKAYRKIGNGWKKGRAEMLEQNPLPLDRFLHFLFFFFSSLFFRRFEEVEDVWVCYVCIYVVTERYFGFGNRESRLRCIGEIDG